MLQVGFRMLYSKWRRGLGGGWQEILDRARGAAGLRPQQLLRSYLALCGRRCLAVLGQDAFDASRGLGPPDGMVHSEAVIMCAPPHRGGFPAL